MTYYIGPSSLDWH